MIKWQGEEITEEEGHKIVAEEIGSSAHAVSNSDEDDLVPNHKEIEEELLEMAQAVEDIAEGEDWVTILGASVDREFAIDYILERIWQIGDELDDDRLLNAIYLFEDLHVKED